jgi:hypothetical protein
MERLTERRSGEDGTAIFEIGAMVTHQNVPHILGETVRSHGESRILLTTTSLS